MNIMPRPKVAIIGAGFMGRGVFWQSRVNPLYDCIAVYDIKPENFILFARQQGIKCMKVDNASQMRGALASGAVAICSDVRLITECRDVDAVIDASSAIKDALGFCTDTLNNGKHLIMVNAEADFMFGHYFLELARKKNVVYTSCDGDQYGVLKNIIDEITLWGFQVVMAGNIKGFLNQYANEANMAAEADKRNFDHKMCASYTDGTKLNIEMALLANCEGYITKTKGMFGPRARHVKDVFDLFDLESLWKDRKPFVDYVLGAEPGGGVYVIGYCEDAFQKEVLDVYKMGTGPFYLFYRPYHLCYLESAKTILDAVLHKKALMQPRTNRMTDVFAYAKKNLKAGELLDGVGGFACYGLIENMADQEDGQGLPICLAEDVRVNRAIEKDSKILLSCVEYDPARPDYTTYYGQSCGATLAVLQPQPDQIFAT